MFLKSVTRLSGFCLLATLGCSTPSGSTPDTGSGPMTTPDAGGPGGQDTGTPPVAMDSGLPPSSMPEGGTTADASDTGVTPPVQDSGPRPDVPVTPPADGGPPPANGDEVPERPLKVDTTTARNFTFNFTPSQADPMATTRNQSQSAGVNTGAGPHRGKLVVLLSGVGSPPGPNGLIGYTTALGFHAMSVAYDNSFNPSTQNNAAVFGNMRQEQFTGMDTFGGINVPRAGSVEVRVAKAMAYLQTQNPEGDWGYFLKSNGEVRWSDVIFMGHSHGASSAAYYAKIRRVWRAISLAGPRDTNPVTATWLSGEFLTPKDRLFGVTGVGDDQHQDHQRAMQTAGYPGALTDISMGAPFANSRRLRHGGGHNDGLSCGGNFNAVCRYMLGVTTP